MTLHLNCHGTEQGQNQFTSRVIHVGRDRHARWPPCDLCQGILDSKRDKVLLNSRSYTFFLCFGTLCGTRSPAILCLGQITQARTLSCRQNRKKRTGEEDEN